MLLHGIPCMLQPCSICDLSAFGHGQKQLPSIAQTCYQFKILTLCVKKKKVRKKYGINPTPHLLHELEQGTYFLAGAVELLSEPDWFYRAAHI